MSKIHPSAIVSDSAQIGDNVTIGPFALIEDDVIVGDDCEIKSSAVLAEGTVLGKGVRIFHGAVIGTVPQDLKFGGEKTKAIIGDGTTIREYVTFNRGTEYHNRTECGKNCLIMAYAHVAHDCLLGNNVIMANSVNLAGHIEIGDHAILGGMLPIHQFVKIGAHAMVGGGYRVPMDIIPYSLSGGYPMKIVGVNKIGLSRRGFSPESIKIITDVFKILFFSKMNTSQAVEKVKAEFENKDEVKVILDFIESSTRGLVK